ncbi:MAG: GntR family transcriptional regulator [Burkholderiaceae bacterium]
MSRLAKLPARTGYVEAVYASLLDAISDGTLAPGARITQEEIAEQLDVSRSPVLQALRMLKKDGLLRDAPGRGLEVTPVELTDIADLYQLRGVLDALAARLAAQRGAMIPGALIDAGREAAASGDIARLIAADTALHRAIYEGSGNRRLLESAELHWIHLRRAMAAELRGNLARAGIWDEHEAIVAAIHAGDAGRAAEMSGAAHGAGRDHTARFCSRAGWPGTARMQMPRSRQPERRVSQIRSRHRREAR